MGGNLMLTKKENLRETIRGGHPDRFVDQYSFMEFMADPIREEAGVDLKPGEEGYNGWGVKIYYPLGNPGQFPLCEGEHKLLKDISKWRDVIKPPRVQFSEEEWAPYIKEASKIDRSEVFATTFVPNGIFEKLHYFMGMEDTMINFYDEPEAMHELIGFITDWEIEYAGEIIRHLHPDALFHHDDWGSQISTFISPAMFEEFIEPAYERIYGYWKKMGVELIVHHSDSYVATLFPHMIRLGIDIIQGPVYENDIPALIKKYGEEISIMAGLDNGKYDKEDWSAEQIRSGLRELFETAGTKYLIPCLTMGGPGSIYPGVYETASEEIDKFSKIYF